MPETDAFIPARLEHPFYQVISSQLPNIPPKEISATFSVWYVSACIANTFIKKIMTQIKHNT